MLPGLMQLLPTDSQDGHRRRFTFDVSRTSRATVMTLGGELDGVCADAFKRRFSEATDDEPEQVVMDVRELKFIDSTGLALLLGVNEMSQDGGFELWIVSADDGAVSKIFRMTGTDRILPLVGEPPDPGSARVAEAGAEPGVTDQ
jgi:anti-sigma B factor antagonist